MLWGPQAVPPDRLDTVECVSFSSLMTCMQEQPLASRHPAPTRWIKTHKTHVTAPGAPVPTVTCSHCCFLLGRISDRLK